MRLTHTAKALFAGAMLAGLSGAGVAAFSAFTATANPFGGADPSTCGDGLDCSASTFTATEASSGPAYAVSSVLTCAVDFGPGAFDCAGTNGSGYVQFPAGAVFDVGSTRVQDAQVIVSNGFFSASNSGFRDLVGAIKLNDTDGVSINSTTAITGMLLVAVTIDLSPVTGGCDDVTATVAGVEANDAVFVTPNFNLNADDISVGQARVTNAAADEVTFRVCDVGGGGADPDSGSFLFWVVRKA